MRILQASYLDTSLLTPQAAIARLPMADPIAHRSVEFETMVVRSLSVGAHRNFLFIGFGFGFADNPTLGV